MNGITVVALTTVFFDYGLGINRWSCLRTYRAKSVNLPPEASVAQRCINENIFSLLRIVELTTFPKLLIILVTYTYYCSSQAIHHKLNYSMMTSFTIS